MREMPTIRVQSSSTLPSRFLGGVYTVYAHISLAWNAGLPISREYWDERLPQSACRGEDSSRYLNYVPWVICVRYPLLTPLDRLDPTDIPFQPDFQMGRDNGVLSPSRIAAALLWLPTCLGLASGSATLYGRQNSNATESGIWGSVNLLEHHWTLEASSDTASTL